MKNAMTKKEYDSIKKETYTLIVFEDNVRILTFGGLNLLGVLQEQAKRQGVNRKTLIVHDSHMRNRDFDRAGISRDILKYHDLFDLKEDALKGAE